MAAPHRIALIGLSDAERAAVTACLQLLSAERVPRYTLVSPFDDAEFVIADAEHTPSVKLVLATERLKRALWVGTPPPLGSVAVVDRPLDVKHLLRELDALVAQTLPAPLLAPADAATEGWAGEDRRRTPLPPQPEPPARTALLVDDSEIALRFLETRLQRFGLLMDRALTSNRAIELMAQRHYDFVFLDLELGNASTLDGLALCQHIKRQAGEGAEAPTVVMVTAHAAEADRVRGTLAGADAYLGKPLDEVALQRLLLRHGLKPRAAPAA
jgi:CheY-like chemotaxis protein